MSALWFAVPAMADLAGADHNEVGRFLRARLNPDAGPAPEPAGAAVLAPVIDGWGGGVERYYAETGIDPAATRTLASRGLDLTLHTTAVEPREVLTGHSVGAATKGGVLEKAIDETRTRVLPAVEAALGGGADPGLADRVADLVADICRTVRAHGTTLAG